MAHSETCPICNGEGVVSILQQPITGKITCHGCNGKGWVEIQDNEMPVGYWPWPAEIMPPTEETALGSG